MRRVHWTKQLQEVIDQHNYFAATRDKVISNRTRELRAETLFNCFRLLRNLGYKLEDVKNFRGKHGQALMNQWVNEGLGPGTIQQKWSALRIYCRWLGKEGMLEDPEKYVSDPALVTRSLIATQDKSWSTNQVDPAVVFAKLEQLSPVIALMLKLELVFALRRRESIMFKPWRADLGDTVSIETNDGPKNGRARMIPVRTAEQRELLDQAKAMIKSRDGRLGELLRSASGTPLRLEQAINRFKNLMHQVGVTKAELHVTAHGLRHEYSNNQYQLELGEPSPVRGGEGGSTPEIIATRQRISRDLGHTRVSITSAYLGGLAKKKRSASKLRRSS